MKIVDGNVFYPGKTMQDLIDGPMRMSAMRKGHSVPPVTSIANVKPLYARIEHGLWIVDCPDCNNAEIVWKSFPFMMCQECWNGSCDYKWRPIKLPKAQDIDLIETALLKRPVHINRNWFPHESVMDLIKENTDHGIK